MRSVPPWLPLTHPDRERRGGSPAKSTLRLNLHSVRGSGIGTFGRGVRTVTKDGSVKHARAGSEDSSTARDLSPDWFRASRGPGAARLWGRTACQGEPSADTVSEAPTKAGGP